MIFLEFLTAIFQDNFVISQDGNHVLFSLRYQSQMYENLIFIFVFVDVAKNILRDRSSLTPPSLPITKL